MNCLVTYRLTCESATCGECFHLHVPKVQPPAVPGGPAAPYRCRFFGELQTKDSKAVRAKQCLDAAKDAKQIVAQLATVQCQKAHQLIVEALGILLLADAKTNGERRIVDELDDESVIRVSKLLKKAKALIPAEEQTLFNPVLYQLKEEEQ